jgi:hypothetical protein
MTDITVYLEKYPGTADRVFLTTNGGSGVVDAAGYLITPIVDGGYVGVATIPQSTNLLGNWYLGVRDVAGSAGYALVDFLEGTFEYNTLVPSARSSIFEAVRIISTPTTLRAEDITVPTRFIFSPTGSFGAEYPLTIEGNWRTAVSGFTEDRYDSIGAFPAISVECNGNKGLLLYRFDNAQFESIRVVESNGTALELKSIRQCIFTDIHLHRCKSTTEICLISGEGYSVNMCSFGMIMMYPFDAPVGLRITGGTTNPVRIIDFANIMLHNPPGGILTTQFPYCADFAARELTMIDFGDAENVIVTSLNCRFYTESPDTCLALKADATSSNIVVLSGQILRRSSGDEARTWISGPIVAFPHRI